jgi:hypothetical protein
MRQAIVRLPLEEPICVCDECLMTFWKNVCCANLCDLDHFEPLEPSPLLMSAFTGGSHVDGLVGNPIGNDFLHHVVHSDCGLDRVEWAVLIADLPVACFA